MLLGKTLLKKRFKVVFSRGLSPEVPDEFFLKFSSCEIVSHFTEEAYEEYLCMGLKKQVVKMMLKYAKKVCKADKKMTKTTPEEVQLKQMLSFQPKQRGACST